MGFHERHIGPRYVRCLCAMADIGAEREKFVPRATGTVGPNDGDGFTPPTC
jgi:hypothetical protein